MEKNSDKAAEYAVKISHQVAEMLQNKDCPNYIGIDTLEEEDTVTEFMYELSTLAPAYIYQELTGDNVDALGFNHIANRLVFQFSKLVKDN